MIFEFIELLSSLARVADLRKCLFLNDEPCMVRPTIINMNPVELKYYPFMISLNKCTGSCKIPDSIVQHVIQIKNGIIKHVNVNVKIIIRVKNFLVGILAHVFVKKESI